MELINVARYIPIMARKGSIYPLTVDSSGLNIPAGGLVINGLRVLGSAVAPRLVYRRMLDFVAHHKIRPMINEFPMTTEGIEQAFEALDKGKLRYRAVLVAPDAEKAQL
jgi:D-arabinose 1-dehydrogenase-like Zn-dependent alcohol dehydrogenase